MTTTVSLPRPSSSSSSRRPRPPVRRHTHAVLRLLFFVSCLTLTLFCATLQLLLLPLHNLLHFFSFHPSVTRMRRRHHRLRLPITIHEPQATQVSTTQPHTLLLIHGFPDSPLIWTSPIRKLTHHGFRCITVSLPGCRGQLLTNAPTLSQLCASLAEELRNSGTHRVTVIGRDFGAVVGRRLAQQHGLVHRVVTLEQIPVTLQTGPSRRVEWWRCAEYLGYMLAFWMGAPMGDVLVRTLLRLRGYAKRDLAEVCCDMAWVFVTMAREWGWLENEDGKDHGDTRVNKTKEVVMAEVDEWPRVLVRWMQRSKH